MEKLCSHVRAAMQKYNMIEAGDRLAVGVSGGKDSLTMLVCLASIKKYYPVPFELIAVAVDPCFNNKPSDYSAVSAL